MRQSGELTRLDRAVMQETGRGAPRIGRWVIVLVATLIGAGAVWASVTHVPGLARAGGALTADGALYRVEHPDGGVLSDLLVSEGDVVTAGQVIAVLSGADLAAELARTESRLRVASARLLRAEQLLSDLPADPDIDSPFMPTPDDLRLQKARAELSSARRRAASEIVRERAAAIRTMRGIRDAVARRVALAQDRVHRQQKLLERGAIAAMDLETAQDHLESQKSELLSAAGNLTAARSAHAEAERNLEELVLSERDINLTELEEARQEVAEFRLARDDLLARQDRLTIRAGADGIVQSLAIAATGEVLEAGGTLAEILPTGVDLVAEVRLDPRDVGQVAIGDRVAVTVTSFDRKRYGQVIGTISTISATSVTERDRDPYYKLRVALNTQTIGTGRIQRPLRAGMVVQTEIVTNPRTVAQYLLKPLDSTLNAALRER